MKNLSELYPAGKSLCTCGHVGDGTNSDHVGIIGHGACSVPGCDCPQFSWKRWTPAFQTFLDQRDSGEESNQ